MQGRAEPDRLGHRHGRADAEGPRLVAGRRDHAALRRLTADRERLAAQRRVVALFDRRVEGVHVDVKDAADFRHDLRNTPNAIVRSWGFETGVPDSSLTQTLRISQLNLTSEIRNLNSEI